LAGCHQQRATCPCSSEKILGEALEGIYGYILNNKFKISKIEIKNLINEIEEITPDTEDFPGILVSFALNACIAIISILSYILDGNEK